MPVCIIPLEYQNIDPAGVTVIRVIYFVSNNAYCVIYYLLCILVRHSLLPLTVDMKLATQKVSSQLYWLHYMHFQPANG
jgi:hypothetical protein